MNQRSVGRTLRIGISTSTLALALALASPAQAQTTAGIRGHVDGAAVGTKVSVTDANTGQQASATVDAQGNYQVFGLRPSNYRVTVGGKTQDAVVPLGQTISVDFVQQGGNGAIVVTGRRRAEVRTATVQTNVSQAQIENLPQNDRNFLNFAALAPGVSVTPSGGDKKVQAGAVSADQINVFVDGLSFKNPVNHGGIAGQNFSLGNPFPQLAVQEFAVDTQNFKAEYEQAGSAIITAVTKTGGTKFHGDVFGEIQPKSFLGRPYFDRPGHANNPNGTNPKPDYRRTQYGADLGGPIIPGLLHFFVAFEGTDQKSPSTTVFIDPTKVTSTAVTSQNGSFPQTFKQKLYFGKLSLFATANDKIDGSVFVRKERNLRDFGGIRLPSAGHDITSNGRLFQLEWQHRSEGLFNELTLAYNRFTNGTPRVSNDPQIVLTCAPISTTNQSCNTASNSINDPTVAVLGGAEFAQNDAQKTFTIKDNLTLNRGDHVIKLGGKLTFNRYERLEDLFSNGQYFFNAATYTGFGTSTPFAARVSTVPISPASAKNTQIGLFIQDDWTPNQHLTVNAGIRWDYETNAKNDKFVTPQKIVDALLAYQPWKAAGINPNDYISTGSNRHPYKYAFQPRLGISYDVNGDRDLILFAGAGRYYDRPLFIEAGIETLKAYFQSTSTLTTPPIPTTVDALRTQALSQGLGGDVWLLNNKTKLPYSDQFNAGIRKRFGEFNTSATVSYVRSHNLFQFVRGNRLPNGGYPTTSVTGEFIIQDSFPRCAAGAAPPFCVNGIDGQLPGYNGKLNIGANGGSASYLALYLTADKPYTKASGWGVTGSFTLQRARTNDDTELGADEFFAGPRQNQFGWEYVNGVPKFTFVGTGIVGLPFDITLSGTVNLTSGPAFGHVAFYPDGAVFNGGGVYFPKKTIAYKTVDLRVAKTFTTPWGHRLTVDFQAYNVFDSVNRSYSTWGAGSGANPTLLENGTVGNARSFQAGLKYSF